MKRPLLTRLAVLLTLLSAAYGCANGIFGKNTVKAVDGLNTTVSQSLDKTTKEIDKTRDSALHAIYSTRDSILRFLTCSSPRLAHDLSISILQGTIGYLDADANREALAKWLETIINRTGGAVRGQLIEFKDQLLDKTFISQIQQLLRTITDELLKRPTENLITLALGDQTRIRLNNMLHMLIPAVLNDSAIRQIGKLRDVLLGLDMKKAVAGLADTVLMVANHRLDTPLRATIHSIVEENGGTIKKYAGSIITGLIVLAIIAGIVIYWMQHQRVKLNQDMLRQVTMKIEELKDSDPSRYRQLTTSIQQAMVNNDLEANMNQFLKEKRIS